MFDPSNSLPIETPENVRLEAEIAGFGTRCFAALLDYVILGIVVAILGVLFSQSLKNAFSSQDKSSLVYLLILFSTAIIITFYHLFFEFLWNGQTPGKRRFGIRVVQSNGLPLTTNAALIRNLVRVFDFLPFFYGVGLIAMFATKNTQRLGDIAAKTTVVRERSQFTLVNMTEDFKVEYQHISRLQPLPAYIQIAALNEQDRRTIVNYLRRRAKLSSREYISGLLAKQMAERMGLTSAVVDLRGRYAEMFLEHVARAFELEQHP